MKKRLCPKCGSEEISHVLQDGKNRIECNDCFFQWKQLGEKNEPN